MSKTIFVSNVVDFFNGRFFVDFAEENASGELVVKEKSFTNSAEADAFYHKLDEQIYAQNALQNMVESI